MGIFNRSTTPPPKTQPLVSKPYNAERRSITASAQPIRLGNPQDMTKMRNLANQHVWQQYAWEYFDLIGQIHFASTIVASLASRLKIFPAFVENEADVPDHITRSDVSDELKKHARDALTLLSDAPGGISGMLKTASMNTFVAGEFYLIKYRATAFNGEYWKVHSRDEIIIENDRVSIAPYPKASRQEYTPVDGKFMARIWNPHPRYSEVADSSMRSIIDDCEEYTIIGRSVRATGRSRLNAGLLLVPDDLASAGADDGEAPDYDSDSDALAPYSEAEADTLEDDLINQFIEPTQDDGSPASVSPLILRGPKESLQAIKYMTLERDFDKQQIDLYNQALNRILTGIDIPKDIVTGLADVKYANGVNVEDSLYKNHIEPMAMFICDGLTSSFLKPVLRSWGHTEEEIRNVTLWYDASSITSKPDKAESANFGYTNNLVNAQAWRRAHNFQETDAPEPKERVQNTVLSMPPNESIMSSVLAELVPEYVAAAQAAYEEATPDTPESIIDGLTEPGEESAPDSETSETPAPSEEESFDDILNSSTPSQENES